MDAKRCERCGASFDCGAVQGSCWCTQAVVPAPVLKTLRARFGDCLCPACLAAEAAASEPAPV